MRSCRRMTQLFAATLTAVQADGQVRALRPEELSKCNGPMTDRRTACSSTEAMSTSTRKVFI